MECNINFLYEFVDILLATGVSVVGAQQAESHQVALLSTIVSHGLNIKPGCSKEHLGYIRDYNIVILLMQ
jgi:hypothetical protein